MTAWNSADLWRQRGQLFPSDRRLRHGGDVADFRFRKPQFRKFSNSGPQIVT